MASYTIEDIEMIRRKSGISYEEAVALLDYHNGNIVYALMDLQRNGKLKEDASDQPLDDGAVRSGTHRRKKGFLGALQWLYQTRIKIRKGETPIVNLSVLFMIAALFFSPKLAVIGLIVSLLCGYKINLDKNDPAFTSDSFEGMVRNAADNVRQSVNGFARDIAQASAAGQAGTAGQSGAGKPKEAVSDPAPAQPMETMSFPSETPGSIVREMEEHERAGNVPTLQMPVRVSTRTESSEAWQAAISSLPAAEAAGTRPARHSSRIRAKRK